MEKLYHKLLITFKCTLWAKCTVNCLTDSFVDLKIAFVICWLFMLYGPLSRLRPIYTNIQEMELKIA